jgi:dTDP-4-amino-4,6-dideoxygalactose transaminase
VTAEVCERAMSIPVHPRLNDADVARVAGVIRTAL